MFKSLIFIVFISGFAGRPRVKEGPDKIVGIWFNEDKTNKVEIYKTGETYSGRIVWLEKLERNPDLQLKDKNNPDPDLRNRKILGLDVISGLEYADQKWINGTIYTPKRGIYAECSVEVLSNERLKLVVKKSGIAKSLVWIRS